MPSVQDSQKCNTSELHHLTLFSHLCVPNDPTLYLQAERTKELALIRAEEEERLATALVKRIHQQERHDKEVQHLREQSAELRE
jgi:hypothetical protein